MHADLPYIDTIRAEVEYRFGYPGPVALVVSQIMQESAFRPNAVSGAGAKGLMQFMDATAKWAAQAGGFGIARPLDPEWSIRSGVWYDRFLYDRVYVFDSKCSRWMYALSDFNGGTRWRLKRQSLSPSPGSWALTGSINPGITPANQRQNYEYPMVIVYALQPKFTHLGPLVCKGDQ